MLEPGARIWVNVGTGYIGVAEVEEAMVPVDDFTIKNESGEEVLLTSESKAAKTLQKAADDIEKADYLVRVSWLKKLIPKMRFARKVSSATRTQ